jgi:hypothetical protein
MAIQTVQKFGKMPDAANATSSAQRPLALSVSSEDHCFLYVSIYRLRSQSR